MNAAGQLAAILFAVAGAAAGTYLIKGPPVRALVCNPAELKPGEICLQQIPTDAKILWVDARPRKDWQKNGLSGSVLWSLEFGEDQKAFEADVAMRIMETPRVIVYCSSESCDLSAQVADKIKGLDLGADVSVLRGGWQALYEAGRIKDSSPKS